MAGKRRRRSVEDGSVRRWRGVRGVCLGLSLVILGGCGGARSFLAPRRTGEPQLLGRVDPQGGTAEKLARNTPGLNTEGDTRLATTEGVGRTPSGAAIRGQSISPRSEGPQVAISDDTAPVPRPLDPAQTRSGADQLVLNPARGGGMENAPARSQAQPGTAIARNPAGTRVQTPPAARPARAVEPPPAEPASNLAQAPTTPAPEGGELVIEPPREAPANDGTGAMASQPAASPAAVTGTAAGDRSGGNPVAAPPAQGLEEARAIVQRGREGLSAINSYRVTLQRQERVGTTLQPDETVVVNIRVEPRAVRLEWPSGLNKGREVIYDSGGDQQMHIHTPNALPPLVRLSLPPTSPMVQRNSRHPITEAGLDTVLASLDRTLERHQKGEIEPGETLEDQGLKSLEPDGPACRVLLQQNAKGEKWTVALDPESGLPVLVLGMSATGELLERHRFSGFTPNVEELQTAAAFQPNARWGEPKSMLSKLPLGLLSGQPAQPEEARR